MSEEKLETSEKENTLFASSLLQMVNNPNRNQSLILNENDSINYDNIQSIIEILNKYPGNKYKNANNQQKKLGSHVSNMQAQVDIMLKQKNNKSSDQSGQQDHQHDYIDELEHYLDNISVGQREELQHIKKEQSLILTRFEQEHDMSQIQIDNNEFNPQWESQLEHWLENINIKDKENKKEDSIDDIDFIFN